MVLMIFYDFATDTVQRFPAERIAPVKRQKLENGPVMPVMAPVIDVIGFLV